MISLSCDSLDSHGSGWSLRCVALLIRSSARRALSVSSTALSTAHPHFYPLCTVALLSVVLLTLVLCYLDDEMLAPRNRWCDDHRAQFTALFLLRFPAQSYLALYGQPGDYLSLPFQGHRLLFFKSHDLKIFFWKGYIKIKV